MEKTPSKGFGDNSLWRHLLTKRLYILVGFVDYPIAKQPLEHLGSEMCPF
jgi:hypothetical protein